jgi:hypothetical protein
MLDTKMCVICRNSHSALTHLLGAGGTAFVFQYALQAGDEVRISELSDV